MIKAEQNFSVWWLHYWIILQKGDIGEPWMSSSVRRG